MPTIDNNGNIVDFNGANSTESLNYKTKITDRTNDDGEVDIEIIAPLEYLSNFWRTLERPLINCELDIILD